MAKTVLSLAYAVNRLQPKSSKFNFCVLGLVGYSQAETGQVLDTAEC